MPAPTIDPMPRKAAPRTLIPPRTGASASVIAQAASAGTSAGVLSVLRRSNHLTTSAIAT